MEKTDARYGAYIQILKEELVPAMGCTEPIALAYGAAVARDILGGMPDRVSAKTAQTSAVCIAELSGNNYTARRFMPCQV